MLGVPVSRVGFGQTPVAPRGVPPALAALAGPTITILPPSTGSLVRSHGASNASLNLGPVSYFKGTSTPGETSRKTLNSFVISSRFVLKIDCPARSSSSLVSVTVSRLDAAASHSISIDGTPIGSAAQTLVQSMPCGSRGEHRLDVEVPISTPAGSIGSSLAFVAMLNR